MSDVEQGPLLRIQQVYLDIIFRGRIGLIKSQNVQLNAVADYVTRKAFTCLFSGGN